MKLEPQDDGYETAADMMVTNAGPVVGHHEVKCEKLEDPYSFIDDDPIASMPQPNNQGQHNMMGGGPPTPTLVQHMMQGPKKRGRKKKIKPEQ